MLAGGTSMVPGFPERLHSELCRCEKLPLGLPIRVIAAPERDRAACVGAAALASDPKFASGMFISRELYEKDGPETVLKSCDSAAGRYRYRDEEGSGDDCLISSVVMRLCQDTVQGMKSCEVLNGIPVNTLMYCVEDLSDHAKTLIDETT